MKNSEAYKLAQKALAEIKTAIYQVLINAPEEGLRNADIGRILGIGYGHSGRHQDHIPRVLLEIMTTEGVVIQNEKTKKWKLRE